MTARDELEELAPQASFSSRRACRSIERKHQSLLSSTLCVGRVMTSGTAAPPPPPQRAVSTEPAQLRSCGGLSFESRLSGSARVVLHNGRTWKLRGRSCRGRARSVSAGGWRRCLAVAAAAVAAAAAGGGGRWRWVGIADQFVQSLCRLRSVSSLAGGVGRQPLLTIVSCRWPSLTVVGRR